MHYLVQVVWDDDHGECWYIVYLCLLIEKYQQFKLHNVKTTSSKYESVMQLPNAASTKALMNANVSIVLPTLQLLLYLGQYAQLWWYYYPFSQLADIAIIIVP